jgi:hypothetical protein
MLPASTRLPCVTVDWMKLNDVDNFSYNAPPATPRSSTASLNGGPVGALATIACKPRQGRKAATVVSDSGAGVSLAGLPPFRGLTVIGTTAHSA